MGKEYFSRSHCEERREKRGRRGNPGSGEYGKSINAEGRGGSSLVGRTSRRGPQGNLIHGNEQVPVDAAGALTQGKFWIFDFGFWMNTYLPQS